MKFIIGIDQSITSTGVCIIGKDFDYGPKFVRITSEKNSTDPMDPYVRVKSICNALADIIDFHSCEDVAIEGLAYSASGDATRLLAGLQFCIMSMLIDKGCSVIIVPPTELKKFASGKGNANKDVMVDSLPDDIKMELLSIKKSDGRYDLTDAYFLANFYKNNKGDDNEI